MFHIGLNSVKFYFTSTRASNLLNLISNNKLTIPYVRVLNSEGNISHACQELHCDTVIHSIFGSLSLTFAKENCLVKIGSVL